MVEIPDNLKKYSKYIRFEAPDPERVMKQLELVDQVISKYQTSSNSRQEEKEWKLHEPSEVSYSLVPYLKILNLWYIESNKKIRNFELDNLKNMIELGNTLKEFIKSSDTIAIQILRLFNRLQKDIQKNDEYNKLKKERKMFRVGASSLVKASQNVDFRHSIQTEFLDANVLYQKEFQYFPPSQFDEVLAEFLYHTEIGGLLEPMGRVIATGPVKSAMCTISELCLEVYKMLNIETTHSKEIIYTSIIRLLFNIAYTIEPELIKYKEQDLFFMEKALEFSKKTVRDVQLTSDISRYYTPGLPLSTLFKPKQIEMLKQLEFMTNPLDIMKHIHSLTVSLAQFFGSDSGMLSFDDMLSLLLALISTDPPINCVSIMKFIDKWHEIQLNDIIGNAKDFFIAAVSQLLPEEYQV